MGFCLPSRSLLEHATSDGFDFLETVGGAALIKADKQIIEQTNKMLGMKLLRKHCETNNVCKQHSHLDV